MTVSLAGWLFFSTQAAFYGSSATLAETLRQIVPELKRLILFLPTTFIATYVIRFFLGKKPYRFRYRYPPLDDFGTPNYEYQQVVLCNQCFAFKGIDSVDA